MAEAARLLKNGLIYTVDSDWSVAQALVIGTDGKILFVGSHDAATELCTEATVVTDLAGKVVLPGFVDNHTHAAESAAKFTSLYLADVKTVPQYIELIRTFANDTAKVQDEVITGFGWEQAVFQEYNGAVYGVATSQLGPSRFLLDEALRGTLLEHKPVKLYSNDYHCAWYNSVAIELARGQGFDIAGEITENRGSDQINRIPATLTGWYHGTDFSLYSDQPWGVMREGACQYVDAYLPSLSMAAQQRQADHGMQAFIGEMSSYGVTLLQDILLKSPNQSPHVVAVYDLLRLGRKQLLWRVSLLGNVVDPEQTVEEFRNAQKHYGAVAEFQFFSVKLFADAIQKGMYLMEPYADEPDNSANIGCLYKNAAEEQIKDFIAVMHRENIPVHIHAMGDRAVKVCLDGFDAACSRYGDKNLHHTLTHLLLVRQEDATRMAQRNIVASINSYWHYKEPFYYEEIFAPLLGAKRVQNMFPAQVLAAADVLTCMATDGEISEKPAPLWGIEIAVTRNAPGATNSRLRHNPRQKLTRQQAVAMATINGAKALGLEEVTGSLDVGKRADLVILAKDIFTIPENQIHSIQVVETVSNGETQYQASGWNP